MAEDKGYGVWSKGVVEWNRCAPKAKSCMFTDRPLHTIFHVYSELHNIVCGKIYFNYSLLISFQKQPKKYIASGNIKVVLSVTFEASSMTWNTAIEQ